MSHILNADTALMCNWFGISRFSPPSETNVQKHWPCLTCLLSGSSLITRLSFVIRLHKSSCYITIKVLDVSQCFQRQLFHLPGLFELVFSFPLSQKTFTMLHVWQELGDIYNSHNCLYNPPLSWQNFHHVSQLCRAIIITSCNIVLELAETIIW